MGLDMYLNGKKSLWTDWANKKNNPTEDGFEISEKVLRLGYWRKHPNLHGYIVNGFAAGKDDCQEIELNHKDLESIILAVASKTLPPTEGFFFGKSDGSEDEETLKILHGALRWLKTKEDNVSRSVVYQASW